MNGLDLFSGIGGITVALQEYLRPIAYCEIETYCQSVLLQRMQEGNLPKAPIWDDIRTLSTKLLPRIDIIYGGFPCQDISVAGRQEGLEGERSGLFFEILRIIDETKVPFIFLENVPNIRTKGAERVCKELSERGYDCRWCNISARDVGARHKRERFFLLAHPRCSQQGSKEKPKWASSDSSRCSEAIPDSQCKGLEGQCKPERIQTKYPYFSDPCGWSVEPEFCGIFDGLPEGLDSSIWEKEWEGVSRVIKGLTNRANRIKALGNSVVPLQVRTAFQILLNIKQ